MTSAKQGVRAILNFGHTFGHAIEAGLGYGTWLHGEAVGCGMVLAAELSVRAGLIEAGYATRLRTLILRTGLPVKPPPLGTERWMELMRLDKKTTAGELRFGFWMGKEVQASAPFPSNWWRRSSTPIDKARFLPPQAHRPPVSHHPVRRTPWVENG